MPAHSRLLALAQLCFLAVAFFPIAALPAQTPDALDISPLEATLELSEKAKAQFGSEEIIKTLGEIADANEANREKFPHAIGKFELIDLSGPSAKWPKKLYPIAVDFWFAADGQKFRSRFNNGSRTGRTPVRVESIVTPEHYIRFSPNWNIRQLPAFPPIEGFEEQSGPIAYRDRAALARGDKWSDALNAASLLYLSQQQPAESYCRLMIQFHQGKKEEWESFPKCYVDIQKQGDRRITKLVFLNPALAAANGRSACIVFDSDAGNLPIRYTSFKEGKLDLDEAWTYEPHQGGLFPASHRHTTYRDGEESHERRLKTASIEFTEPKESDFDLDRLNFQYGDRLHDKLEKKLLIWDGVNFVSAEGFKFDKSKAPAPVK